MRMATVTRYNTLQGIAEWANDLVGNHFPDNPGFVVTDLVSIQVLEGDDGWLDAIAVVEVEPDVDELAE